MSAMTSYLHNAPSIYLLLDTSAMTGYLYNAQSIYLLLDMSGLFYF